MFRPIRFERGGRTEKTRRHRPRLHSIARQKDTQALVVS